MTFLAGTSWISQLVPRIELKQAIRTRQHYVIYIMAKEVTF